MHFYIIFWYFLYIWPLARPNIAKKKAAIAKHKSKSADLLKASSVFDLRGNVSPKFSKQIRRPSQSVERVRPTGDNALNSLRSAGDRNLQSSLPWP